MAWPGGSKKELHGGESRAKLLSRYTARTHAEVGIISLRNARPLHSPHTMNFREQCRYVYTHGSVSHVLLAKARTPTSVTLWDGMAKYVRKIRHGDGGQYVDLNPGMRLHARNKVDASVHIGRSDSLMDQEWYVDTGL